MTQQTMPNPVDLIEKATNHAKAILSGVKQEQLNDSTPCSEWSVKDLVNHMINGAQTLKAALSGNTSIIDFGSSASSMSTENDVAELLAGYNSLFSDVLQEIKGSVDLATNVPTPAGEMTGGQFIIASSFDQLIHSWDLAKATGQDATLDPELSQVCYQMFVPNAVDMARSAGLVGPAVAVPDSASTQDKLLGYTGRQP